MQQAGAALEVIGVHKAYGPTVALDGVDLEVAAGSVLALLAPNGAGKTSLVSIVAGIRRADTGMVRVNGCDVTEDPRGARRQIGFAPQDTGVDLPLSVHNNLRFFAGLAGLRGRERAARIDAVVDALGLRPLVDRRASALSGGERRRLHTAIALVHRPGLVLLDEPTTGADVRTRAEILQLVRGLADEGSAIVYSTHYLHEVEQLDARVAFMDRGRVVARGTLNELVRRHGSSALVLTFDDEVPSLVCGDGAVVDGHSVRIPSADPAETAARLLPHLGSDAAALRSIEVVRPDLDSVFLAVTGRRYELMTPEPAA
jgi:ABC-2 type transport system ATP-binding protein